MSTFCDIICQVSANMTSDILPAWWSSQVIYQNLNQLFCSCWTEKGRPQN
jgi:hypothetical protein